MNGIRSLSLGLALAILGGCTSGVKEEEIQVKAPTDPIANAKAMVQRYADGQPVSSEATSFPYMVEEVRKVDPAKADALKAGLEEIQQSPETAATKAKELLEKL